MWNGGSGYKGCWEGWMAWGWGVDDFVLPILLLYCDR